MQKGLQIINENKVNKWLCGKWNGIGFSIKNGWLEIGADFDCGNRGLELETKIRKEIMKALVSGSNVDPKVG